MNGWKIIRIPTITELTDECFDLYSSLRNVLYAIYNVAENNSSIEIVFSHEKQGEVSIYLFSHFTGAFDSQHIISQHLTTASYQFEALDSYASERIYSRIMDNSTRGCFAVAKNEKLVTTGYVPEGYYYWADPVLRTGEKTQKNFTAVFQALLNHLGAFVSFQLIPTHLTAYEINSLQYLSGFLDHRVKNPLPGSIGISAYEPYALPAFQAYSHVVSKLNQPFFLYNILAYAPNMQSASLAMQISSWLQSEADTNAEIHAFPLATFQHRGSSDVFPVEVSDYILRNCRDPYIWGGQIPAPTSLFRLPFLVSENEAELFFKLPLDDGVIKGISGTSYRASNERLSVDVTSNSNIIFGTAVTAGGDTIGASEEAFSKHALIVGMPGTGKTTFSVNLLMQFAKRGIPFLAIEPTKAEYRAMIDAIDDLQIYTPGNNSVSPFVLNPFIPPKGITVEKYIPSLFSGFRAAFSMPTPLDAAFLQAIRSTYTRYGWRDYSKTGDPEVTPFGMHEFIIVFKDLIEKSNYSREVKGNLQSGGVLRLSNLLQQNRYIFDTINTIPVEDLLSRPTVIELNAIDNPEQKALIISLLLINIGAYVKSKQAEPAGLENVILLDEAHVLLGQKQRSNGNDTPDAQSFAVQLVENLIAEIRAYGTSIIIADQRPSAVGDAIVANTDIKIVFRLTEKREKEIIAESADFDESMQTQISHLDRGQAFVYYNRLYKPQLVQTPDIRKDMNIRIKVSDEEVQSRCRAWVGKEQLLKPYSHCRYCLGGGLGCAYKIRADAEFYASSLWDKISSRITDAKSLLVHCNGIPILLEGELRKQKAEDRDGLIICIRLAFIRKAESERGIFLTEKQKDAVLSTPKVRNNNDG